MRNFKKEFYEYIGKPIDSPLGSTNRNNYNAFVSEELIEPHLKLCKQLELSPKELEQIKTFALLKSKAKGEEWAGLDDYARIKRELTGATIEFALLKKYGRELYFDNSIVARSSTKNYPDLLPLGVYCDVKGASFRNVPMVFIEDRTYTDKDGTKYKCPNVIGITNNTEIWLLGIASPEILRTYVDRNLIKDDSAFSEAVKKTGFYGFDKLIKMPDNWDAFVKICNDLKIS